MKRYYTLILLIFGIYAGAQTPYLDLVARADSAAERDDLHAAVALLDSALIAEPTNPGNVMLLSNKAIYLSWLGDLGNALDAINKAHSLAPSSATILNNRAHIYHSMGDYGNEYKDLTAALAINPDHHDARFARVMLSIMIGNLDTADSDIDYLLEKLPDDSRTRLMKAIILNERQKYPEAVAEYTLLIDNDEPSSIYYSGRASAYISLNMLTEASNDIAEGLRIEPDDAELYVQRARLNHKYYLYNDAKADIKRALELGANPEYIHSLGLD